MIRIVPAESAHIPGVLELERSSMRPPWSSDALTSELGRGDAYFGAAVEDGRVLGYCVLRLISGEAELFRIAVADGRRRSGIGARLLEDALRFCTSNGAAAVYLEVRQGNAAAIGLYEKYGFSCAGRRKNYYSNPAEDAVIMVLNMSPGRDREGDV
jgi:ribosomal-protein-alanine N-acetyltransferase